MAVSPLVIQNGSADPKVTAAKAKALAVRTNSITIQKAEAQPAKDTGPELAEQLNEDEKQKYVKGCFFCLLSITMC